MDFTETTSLVSVTLLLLPKPKCMWASRSLGPRGICTNAVPYENTGFLHSEKFSCLHDSEIHALFVVAALPFLSDGPSVLSPSLTLGRVKHPSVISCTVPQQLLDNRFSQYICVVFRTNLQGRNIPAQILPPAIPLRSSVLADDILSRSDMI